VSFFHRRADLFVLRRTQKREGMDWDIIPVTEEIRRHFGGPFGRCVPDISSKRPGHLFHVNDRAMVWHWPLAQDLGQAWTFHKAHRVKMLPVDLTDFIHRDDVVMFQRRGNLGFPSKALEPFPAFLGRKLLQTVRPDNLERHDPVGAALAGTVDHSHPTLAELTQGEIEATICDGISRFEQEYMGRGPKDIHAHLLGDLLVVRLQGVLTAAARMRRTPLLTGNSAALRIISSFSTEQPGPTLQGGRNGPRKSNATPRTE
jgi:hypothetical protein